MPLMLSELYDALLEAGASDEKARKAAEAAAVVDTRFSALEGRMTALEGRMQGLESRMIRLTWMVGLNLTLTLGVLWRLLK